MNLVKKGRILLELRLDMFNKSNALFQKTRGLIKQGKQTSCKFGIKKGLYKKRLLGASLAKQVSIW